MKKTTFIFIALCIGIVTTFVHADYKQEEIKLKRTTQSGQMRSPATSSARFTAYLSGSFLTVQAENYTGDIQVQVLGQGALSTSFYVEESGASAIDISSLEGGDYILMLITSQGVYIGEFYIL